MGVYVVRTGHNLVCYLFEKRQSSKSIKSYKIPNFKKKLTTGAYLTPNKPQTKVML